MVEYTLQVFKADHRTKTGDRLFTTMSIMAKDDNQMRGIVAAYFDMYSPDQGWRYEWCPAKRTVKSLMTGKDVEIDYDTPWSCNPSSETYWSM
jgi:hypothetical protein